MAESFVNTFKRDLPFASDPRQTIVLTSYDGNPGIHTFDNVRILGSDLIAPLTKITVVMEDDFPQRQGLWLW